MHLFHEWIYYAEESKYARHGVSIETYCLKYRKCSKCPRVDERWDGCWDKTVPVVNEVLLVWGFPILKENLGTEKEPHILKV